MKCPSSTSAGRDPRLNGEYRVIIRCQRLGEDIDKDHLVNVTAYLGQIRDYVRKIARKLTEEETTRLQEMLAQRE
jgi:hypothetical protein